MKMTAKKIDSTITGESVDYSNYLNEITDAIVNNVYTKHMSGFLQMLANNVLEYSQLRYQESHEDFLSQQERLNNHADDLERLRKIVEL